LNLAATNAAARREVKATFHTATCEIRTVASGFTPNASARVACSYEQTNPIAGEKLEYEGGNGYGYSVRFLDAPVAIKENDLVVIVASPTAADVGMKIQVQQIPPFGSNGLVSRIDGVRRNA
jgi:hypothetical protein